MNRKLLSIILVIALIFSISASLALNVEASANGVRNMKGRETIAENEESVEKEKDVENTLSKKPLEIPNKKKFDKELIPMDIGSYLRYMDKQTDMREGLDKKVKRGAEKINSDVVAAAEGEDTGDFTYNGGTKYFLGYDNGEYYFKTYTLRSLGENIEVWVADDISYIDDREDPVVTQEQVDLMRDEFDSNIYPTDTNFFGMPDSHTGENSMLVDWGYFEEGYYEPEDDIERVIMLVDNVRDEQFYDEEYPFYVAGFYSPTYQDYFDRNIITIDTHKWEERLESIYYGVVAHEFQHLIHDDNDPYETTWVNEGMSDFAEFLCGYGHPESHVEFFLQHPENSLVEWDDQYSADTGPETLADYGQTYLLTLYMFDKYGQEFIKNLAQDTDQGFTSVNKILNIYGTGIDFGELFRRFSIAVAIDSYMPGEGIYEFDSIDVNVDFEVAQEYDKDGVPAWGGDYKILEDAAKIQNITFDGVDFLPIKWMVVDDPLAESDPGEVLWGNEGHGIDNEIIFEVDLTSVTGAALNFDTFMDIEEDWDAGFVQVSTDGGYTWTSLENDYTVDDTEFPINVQAPEIYYNLPGLTGYSDEWINMEFDLTPYTGQEVLLSFRYMTDMAYNDTGWFIDNISIPEIGYYNDCSSLEGFTNLNELYEIYVDYVVTFINKKSLGIGQNNSLYKVLDIEPFNVSEAEAITLKEFLSGGENYMIIWYAAPDSTTGVVDYTYEITEKSDLGKAKSKE